MRRRIFFIVQSAQHEQKDPQQQGTDHFVAVYFCFPAFLYDHAKKLFDPRKAVFSLFSASQQVGHLTGLVRRSHKADIEKTKRVFRIALDPMSLFQK